jgi:hypothetical protein
LKIVNVAAISRNRAACAECVLIRTVLEFRYRRTNAVPVDPAFYDKGVCAYSLRHGQERVKPKQTPQQERYHPNSDQTPPSPGQAPALFPHQKTSKRSAFSRMRQSQCFSFFLLCDVILAGNHNETRSEV